MSQLDYEIVVPSRNRVGRAEAILKLIPTAIVYVHESEEQQYSKVVPKSQLRTHNRHGLPQIRNYMMQDSKTSCVVQCDDDLNRVLCLVGQKVRTITEPQAILRIIENSIRVCREANIKSFTYSINANPLHFVASNPIKLNSELCCLIGILDKTIPYDEEYEQMSDADHSLQHLLKNRVTYCDNRFFFDYGTQMSEHGGLQGIRTSEGRKKSIERLKRKWGAYVVIEKGVKVNRKNKLV